MNNYRAGYVGFVGQANSGKSTLLNALIGEKVSIVTGKPQTTRRRVVGIASSPEFQCLFVDAPGMTHSTSGINQFLEYEYKDVIKQSDGLLAILNLDEKAEERIDRVIQTVSEARKPWAAIITKTDLPKSHRVEKIQEKLAAFNIPCIAISALQDPNGCREAVFSLLPALLPPSPAPLFPDDLYTTSTVREMCEEYIREQCFENLHQEIPFGLAVRITRFQGEEEEEPLAKIFAEILLSKENHRPMVIGAGGQMLKKIGSVARQNIEKLLDKKVYLELNVQARRQWATNPRLMEELGYVVQTNA